MERLNKEYIISVFKNCKLHYGSTNRKSPKVIYIIGKLWIEPSIDNDYMFIINNLKKKMKQQIKAELSNSNIFDSNFLFYLNVNIDSIKLKKKNFLEFEIYVKQKKTILSLSDIKTHIIQTFYSIILFLIDNLQENHFMVTKCK